MRTYDELVRDAAQASKDGCKTFYVKDGEVNTLATGISGAFSPTYITASDLERQMRSNTSKFFGMKLVVSEQPYTALLEDVNGFQKSMPMTKFAREIRIPEWKVESGSFFEEKLATLTTKIRRFVYRREVSTEPRIVLYTEWL